MHVFLTGASGYIGGAVADALQKAEHTVTGLARSDKSAQELEGRGIRVLRGDLSDTDVIARGAREADGVIHTAATGDANTPAADHGAREAIIAALAGSNKPFVYTAGLWDMGNTGETPVDEDGPLHPPAITAWRAEAVKEVLAAAGQGIRTVVIRPGMVYGRGAGAPTSFVQSARQEGAARFVGDGANHWSLVDVDDLADLYVRALEHAPAGTLLLAVAGPAVAVHDIAEAASRAASAGGRVQAWPLEQARQAMGPMADALALDQHATAARASRLLGWTPQAPSVLDQLAQGGY
jgi:nucleoside-diphosphate-sugar epimerase